MARPEVEGDWVRRMNDLTVVPHAGWPADEVAAATRVAHRLVHLARRLVTSGLVTSGCDGVACAFDCIDGPDRPCELTWDLACAGFPTAMPSDVACPDSLVADYLDALAASGGAVFVCRRTLHTSGECLFTGSAAPDLCARLLVAAHRVGGRRR